MNAVRGSTLPRLALAAGLGLAVIACAALRASPSPTAFVPASPAHLTIFGAASLRDALQAIETAYEAANPGITITISADSSAALATQIEQGAPADVFLSADTSNSRRLVEAGLVAGQPVVFAGNELTIVVPAGNPAGIATWHDLADDGLRIVAAGDEVPITTYAAQLLENLAREADAPARFPAAYAANVVSREDNVKAILAKIELGEGDAGIVYRTDARASTKVTTIALPDDANVPVSYAAVVIKLSTRRASAEAFLAWLRGVDGQDLLAGFGFLPPPA